MFYSGVKKENIDRLERVERRYNEAVSIANDLVLELFSERKSGARAIELVEDYVNFLANTPKDFIRDIQQIKLDLKEFNQAVQLEEESNSNNLKGASLAGSGAIIGGTIVSLGPTAAMAVATTFGTASTGTAIAGLSGAAATNAALAWLGGGALAAGGGGMTAGSALLALAGPIGWGIAGTLAVGGSIFAATKNKKAAEKALEATIELEKKYSDVVRIITKIRGLISSTQELKNAIRVTQMVNMYPSNYLEFSLAQKMNLGTLVNNTKSLGVLINERIN